MIGRTVSHYRVVAEVGRGGMGVVYAAEDLTLRRRVALKFLPPDLAADPVALERFQREARSASSLDHPNICAIHELAEHEGERFIVMPLLDGQTLDRLVTGRFPVERVLDIATQVARGLEAAHGRGIVHRDIKPGNIFITTRGEVKILDFGLAKPTRADAAAATTQADLTGSAVAGTVAYMSPEQARGLEVDARTDLFSFGAVLYELATGQRAPLGGRRRVVPPALDAVIARALEPDREVRYQSAADVRADLERVRRDLGSTGVARRASRRGLLVGGAIGVLAVAVAAWYVIAPGSGAVGDVIDSIAVLPFTTQGSDADTEFLGDGITDSLINGLAQLPGLRVVPRTSVSRYREATIDPQEVGRALKVRAVLTGSVTRRGNTLVIDVVLVDAARHAHLWGDTYRRQMTDLLTVQTSIATMISTTLRARLTPDEIRRVANTYTQNVEAYQLYLRGLYHRQKTSEQGFLESLKYFQRAIDVDPAYPLAYVGLSDSYGSLGYLNILPAGEVWPKAKAAAEAALKLDDTLAEGHAALGHAIMRYDWDLPKAQAEIERAIALNPRYGIARHWYAHLQTAMGQGAEAMAESRKAVELEPLDLMLNTHLLFYLAGPKTRDELMTRIASVREIEPDFWAAHTVLGAVHLQIGEYGRARQEFELGVKHSNGMALAQYFMARSYAAAGRRRDAESALAAFQRQPYVSASWVAGIRGALGQKDEAFKWLERAFRERDSWLIEVRAWPASIRQEPRFQDLMRRMGLQK